MSLVLMALAVVSFGFVSCSDDEDEKYTVSYTSDYGTAPTSIEVEEDTVLSETQLPTISVEDTNGYIFNGWYDGETKAVAGTYKVTKNVTLTAKWTVRYANYWGTWSLMGSDYSMWAEITKDSFSWATKGYGTTKTEYEYVKWATDSDGNAVFYGYPTEKRYTDDDPAASLTFTAEKVLFDVPSMKNNAYVQNYTSAELTAGDAYENQYEGYAPYWGTYTGSLTVNSDAYDITVTVSNGKFAYSSTKMSGEYTNIAWEATSSGRSVSKWTLSGYADTDTDKETAKIIFEADLSGDSPAYTFTVNVAAMGTPSSTLTKSE